MTEMQLDNRTVVPATPEERQNAVEAAHATNAPGGHPSKLAHDAVRHDNLKFSMWLFLASEVILFTVLIVGYVLFRIDQPDIVAEVHEQAGVLLVTLNTFLLLSSSYAMVMGLRALQMDDRRRFLQYIGATAALGIVFVLLQVVEYDLLSSKGITLYGSEFGMRFYAPTAMHGAHVIVGVLWALFVLRNGARGAYSNRNYIGVELFGLYWHFVDVVWIVLFTVIYLI
jgi:heme/copper-type cytochrome/quinol oxidase subunit 3